MEHRCFCLTGRVNVVLKVLKVPEVLTVLVLKVLRVRMVLGTRVQHRRHLLHV
jgi:hypothetical protein